MEKRLAVVILNWNGREYLSRFLPSVVESLPLWAEAVVADNGSTDDSLPWLKSHYPHVRILSFDRNFGFAEGYNRAMAQIDTPYAVLLNSDVEVTPGWLEPLLERFEADADVVALMPKIRSYAQRDYFEYAGAAGGFIDSLGYPFCRGRILNSVELDQGQYDSSIQVFWASGAAFAVRVDRFREAGGFDADFFAHMEEIDLCWRLQMRSGIIECLPQSVVYHVGGGTLAQDSPRKTELNFRNNLMMLYKNLPQNRLCITLVIRMILDGAAAGVYLLSGRTTHFRAVWRAHRDFRRALPLLRQKRREVQQHALTAPVGVYRGSIVWRKIIGKTGFPQNR